MILTPPQYIEGKKVQSTWVSSDYPDTAVMCKAGATWYRVFTDGHIEYLDEYTWRLLTERSWFE